MVTYFLSIDEVRAYLRDFLARLERLKPMPTVWCPVTKSGTTLLEKLLPLIKKNHSELAKNIVTIGVGVDAETKAVKFETKGAKSYIANKSVLLFDSALHTGGTMRRSVAEAIKLGASSVATYSLVIKRGSCFVPTFWGMMIDDTDRIYFLLDKIPNSRLDYGPEKDKAGKYRKVSCVHIARLCEAHLKNPKVKCGVNSLDRVTWGDRNFDMAAGEHKECTYVLEDGAKIVGYLSLHLSDPDCLFITEIAVDKKYQSKGRGKHRRKGKGYGAILLRFADTLARQSNCSWVRLNAIKNQMRFYKGFDYSEIPGRNPIILDEEEYIPMEHKVVYVPFKLTL